jgi:hypothetical protein
MLEVYRKRTRSNVLLEPSQFTAGRIVWVATEGGVRQEAVCTGEGTEVVSQDEFRRRREKRAAENRARYKYSPSRRSSGWNHGFGLCAH